MPFHFFVTRPRELTIAADCLARWADWVWNPRTGHHAEEGIAAELRAGQDPAF